MFLRLFLAVAAGVQALGFALLGPFEAWQTPDLGYYPFNGDVGGPRNLGEEYRWNTPIVTYGFDRTFVDYFGEQGIAAVQSAFAILNEVPPAEEMDLESYPRDTRRINYSAQNLHLLDLKSTALSLVVEQLGLTSPERFAWTLRARAFSGIPSSNAFVVIQRNFDPISLLPSAIVNLSRYTYQILEGPNADAREFPADPDSALFGFSSVISFTDPVIAQYSPGIFLTGLTRDDAGGIRYLLSAQNFNLEPLPVGAQSVDPASPPVSDALRPGVDKLTFEYFRDWETEFYSPRQVEWTDRFQENGVVRTQVLTRFVARPDIVFSAGDLGYNGLTPILFRRTGPNFYRVSTGTEHYAGILAPPVTITFAKISSGLINIGQPATEERGQPLLQWRWGSFDGTTNAPIIFPDTASGKVALGVIRSDGQLAIRISPSSSSLQLQTSTNLVSWTPTTELPPSSEARIIPTSVTNSATLFFRAIRLP